MFQLKLISPDRKLDIPTYSLSEKKTSPKSCFIDNNRIDTVKASKKIESEKLNESQSKKDKD